MISNLEEKLNGSIPVTKRELFKLVSSWGRKDDILTNENIRIEQCNPKECYDLSNLDVSKIKDLSYVFRQSYFNGDLSKWDVSNCTNLERIFSHSEFNNNSINNWNVSNVKDMDFIFYKSKFNGDISNWNISKVKTFESSFDSCPFDGDISKWKFKKDVNCFEMFFDNKNFRNKYNNGELITSNTGYFLEWFEQNRDKIKKSNISDEEIIDFFSFDNQNIELDKEL